MIRDAVDQLEAHEVGPRFELGGWAEIEDDSKDGVSHLLLEERSGATEHS